MRRPSLHGDPLPASIHLLLNVGSEFDVLVEVADMAGNVLVGLKAKWDNRNETKRKPSPIAERS